MNTKPIVSQSLAFWSWSCRTDLCGWLLLLDRANLNMRLPLVLWDCCLCMSERDFILTGDRSNFLSQRIMTLKLYNNPVAAERLLIFHSTLAFLIPHLSFVWHRRGCNCQLSLPGGSGCCFVVYVLLRISLTELWKNLHFWSCLLKFYVRNISVNVLCVSIISDFK